MMIPFAILLFSITILYFGAEFTLDASEKVGARLGLSPLIIGMLLIGFGTSLPEMFVAHIAGSQGKAGIAIGSLVGSNIANMFLILGVAGLITKLSVFTENIQKHLAVHLLLGLILIFVLTRDELNMVSTIPLLLLCGFYLFVIFKEVTDDKEEHKEDDDEKTKGGILLIKLIAGFTMLYFGGEYLVMSGTQICLALGISEYIVSAILIAFGTSFPELVTAVMAAVKKKDTDLIIGNIVGSNMFNCALILASLGVYEFKIFKDFSYELVALVVGAALLLILCRFEKYFFRKTASLFLCAYGFIVLKWVGVF